ncbi:uncharacterized protein LOC135265978 [Tribolium castaneum]|uniref:uncharacterized protein LOC135265978 n=1 Tax=Tribolium castaneum TaxID=7070 RepID=UPI0030FF3E3F
MLNLTVRSIQIISHANQISITTSCLFICKSARIVTRMEKMARISDFKEENQVFVPELVIQEASEAINKVVPAKSKQLYEKEYSNFCEWRKRKDAKGVDERIILAYISERSKNAKSSLLWAYYSQLKKMLSVKENIDISRFHQVSAFLKQHSVGHRPKKSKVFSFEEMEKFLDTVSYDEYLLQKVVLIVGVFGGCRIGELVAMSVDDVHDRGNVIVVNIPDTKTYKPRTFTINGSNSIPAIDVFRKYRKLRLESILHKRLFINNHKQKCTVQPFGINIISKFPEKIARFLCLPNSEEYTGHSFRRSSATLLADSGADLAVVKRHGGWRSNSVVEGYIEDFLNNKIEILRKIINHSLTIIQKESTSNSEARTSASSVSN